MQHADRDVHFQSCCYYTAEGVDIDLLIHNHKDAAGVFIPRPSMYPPLRRDTGTIVIKNEIDIYCGRLFMIFYFILYLISPWQLASMTVRCCCIDCNGVINASHIVLYSVRIYSLQ